MESITVALLTELRDQSKITNQRLDQTVERLDQTVERLDRLERRQVETEIRLATELTAVTLAIRQLTEVVSADRDLRRNVADHERRLQALERRT